MKIISWNVNGIRAVERKGNLKEFLEIYNPDIFCIQETKAKPEQIEKITASYPEFEKFYHSAEKPGYAGSAIWIKKSKNIEIQNFTFGFPEKYDYQDHEGRISRVDFEYEGKAFSVLGIYFPNGGKSLEAWDDKLVFYQKFLDYVNDIRKEGKICIWGGDVNCAHQEIDLARPKDNDGNIGFHPKERQWIDKVIKNNWVDIWRKTNPEKKEVYSWWHVITRARLRNVGWRLDYFFCDKDFFERIKKVEYLNSQMGSDHCPIVIEV